LTFSQTLNARQRPETLQLKNGAGSTLQSLTYGYSAAGDVTWCVFRAKPVRDSAACRSRIPPHAGPRFRVMSVQ
jgi:hypothetical protein